MTIQKCLHLIMTEAPFMTLIFYSQWSKVNYQLVNQKSSIETSLLMIFYFLAFICQFVYLQRKERFNYSTYCLTFSYLIKIFILWVSLTEIGIQENILLIYQITSLFDADLDRSVIQTIMMVQATLNCFKYDSIADWNILKFIVLGQIAICLMMCLFKKVLLQKEIIRNNVHQNTTTSVLNGNSLHMNNVRKSAEEQLEDEPWLKFKWLLYEKYMVINSRQQLKYINFDLSNLWKQSSRTDQPTIYYFEKLLEQPMKTNDGSIPTFSRRNMQFKQFLENNDSHNIETLFQSIGLQSQLFELTNYNINVIGLNGKDQNYFIIHFIQTIKLRDQNNLLDICRSLSHELGTCLNLIQTLSSAGLQNDELDNNCKLDYFKPIHTNCQQLNLIISNFRDYSAVEIDNIQLGLSTFDLTTEIIEIVSFFKDTCESKNIRLKLPSESFSIFNDKDRFKQIFYQIISNAVRFTTFGFIEITLKQIEGVIQIQTKDTGVGMTPVEQLALKRLLSQSITAKRISKSSIGASLGLFISNTILKKLNQDEQSSITFISSNEGSIFTFNIKNMSDALDNVSKIRSQDQSRSIIRLQSIHSYYENKLNSDRVLSRKQQKHNTFRSLFSSYNQNVSFGEGEQDSICSQEIEESVHDHVIQQLPIMIPKFQEDIQAYSIFSNCCPRVLIVDDEYFNIIAMQTILKRYNTICDHAYNGNQALEQVIHKSNTPCEHCHNRSYQLIFLDINMPVMGGLETVSSLRKLVLDGTIRKSIVIANTGFTDLETKIVAYEAGMDYFLTKPLSFKELGQIIRKHFPKG